MSTTTIFVQKATTVFSVPTADLEKLTSQGVSKEDALEHFKSVFEAEVIGYSTEAKEITGDNLEELKQELDLS